MPLNIEFCWASIPAIWFDDITMFASSSRHPTGYHLAVRGCIEYGRARWYKMINIEQPGFARQWTGGSMYALFYGGYLLFGGIGYVIGGVAAMDLFRRREEKHLLQMHEANVAGYWTGFGQAWPVAFRQGEEGMLQVCQALASESADMAGLDQGTQEAFNQLVASWPQYALTQQDAMAAGQSFPV
jgi:hypothetical protein